MKVKMVASEQIWQSSDGQRTIWEVRLKGEDGKKYNLKTYSSKIAEQGYEGEVRSYVNPRGERFVRQVPGAVTPGFQRGELALRAQWAIGQAINLASVKMDKEQITLPVIEKYAKELFATVSSVKGETLTPEMEAQGDQYIKGFTQAPGLF
jgi:hypothetical protein